MAQHMHMLKRINLTNERRHMENSIYLALSKQVALKTNMDIVANNIANMNTSGFRGQNPVFDEYLSDPMHNEDELSFVIDYGQYQVTDQGPLTHTTNPLNVALNGPGFMAVQKEDGSIAYTRDGNFQKTADGTLVNLSGMPIMGQGGAITLPADATDIIIDENGIISDQDGPIGALQIVEFENVQELQPEGHNLYITESPTIPAENTEVRQGFVEGSNVNSVTEMTRMIEIMREFQSNSRLLENEHDRLKGAIKKLTEV